MLVGLLVGLLVGAVSTEYLQEFAELYRNIGPASCEEEHFQTVVNAGALGSAEQAREVPKNLAEAQVLCLEHPDCGGFLYKPGPWKVKYCTAGTIVKSDKATEAAGFIKRLVQSESEKWTSTCSHIRCAVSEDGQTEVQHSSEEQHGDKHVCTAEMHRKGYCGCECYSEAEGLPEFLSFLQKEVGTKVQGTIKKSTLDDLSGIHAAIDAGDDPSAEQKKLLATRGESVEYFDGEIVVDKKKPAPHRYGRAPLLQNDDDTPVKSFSSDSPTPAPVL